MRNNIVVLGLVLLASLFLGGRNIGDERAALASASPQLLPYDYELIINDEWKLEAAVKAAMRDGWQPVGGATQGMFTLNSSGARGLKVIQAMVKYR